MAKIRKAAQEFQGTDWEKVFQQAEPELTLIEKTIGDEEFYPHPEDVFKAFQLTPLKEVKVVILGQDPYPQALGKDRCRATGMAFSIHRDDKIPSSLNNMYKEMMSCYPGHKKPTHGDLSGWAKQGVLLLNTSLTVKPGAPNSHGIIWHGFIYRVLHAILEVNPKCIFLLWGRNAQRAFQELVKKEKVVHALEAAHPSGLSANRGFYGCRHFKKVNDILEENEIDWFQLD
jgi:uracil-DNA glycosylase